MRRDLERTPEERVAAGEARVKELLAKAAEQRERNKARAIEYPTDKWLAGLTGEVRETAERAFREIDAAWEARSAEEIKMYNNHYRFD